MSLLKLVTQSFSNQFAEEPQFIIRAPGRVNLIGEHTDYNDGFVMPMAIKQAVWLAIRPRNDGQIWLNSLEMDEPIEFEIEQFEKSPGHWGDYVKGVTWSLLEAGYDISGFEGVMTSDVPVGAGLSSSAALEMAVAQAFMALSHTEWDPAAMAKIGQRAENEWIGANTGIMDQMISASGKAGNTVLIDCRDLSSRFNPIPEGTIVVIMDTMTRHSHAESGYNERRAQCEEAARHFGVSHLRDLTLEQLKGEEANLDRVVYRRARHVISENERVLEAEEAMQQGNPIRLGTLMNASHASLRDDFEVTNRQLDMMAALAQETDGCYGARMTGGGFGGCAVALVQEEKAESFAREVAADYLAVDGLNPNIYFCFPTDGVRVISGWH